MHLTTQEISEAIKDEEWQAFRVSLKGKTTTAKLVLLDEYLFKGWADDDLPKRLIRVQNYLNALSRGGQLAPLELDRPVDWQIRHARVLR